MAKRIYFNFINIENDFFFNLTNCNLIVTKFNEFGYKTYASEYSIQYFLEENTLKKKYFIEIFNVNIDELATINFNLEIINFLFEYAYFNGELEKSLIIYNIKNNNYQFVYLGLPNLKTQVEIQINYDYYYIGTNSQIKSIKDFKPSSQIIIMLNNYQGVLNYNQNSILLNPTIYEIYIYKDNGIIDTKDSSTNNYKLFNIDNNIYLNTNTRIYFYNNINTFSYILYLNSYNFTEFKLFPENYETIILMIEYINLPGDIYIKNTIKGKYFYKIDSNGEENEVHIDITNDEIKYQVILSLNLQTFNSNQPKISEPDKYYNVLFFKNYINDNYIVKSIRIFEYDYNKYFVNTLKIPEYYNILDYNSDLYEMIIENDNNLTNPIIPNVNYLNILTNLDLINLLNLIKYDCENYYFNNFLKSNEVSVETLINYLSKFVIIEYNVYDIINVRFENLNIIYASENINIYKNNYLYNLKKTYVDNKNTNSGIINFNNNIVNSIRCKIVFLFERYGYYSFEGKIYLNNYNVKIYHKKYDINNFEKKKKFINLLLYIASLSWGIKILFYNNLNSEPKVSSFYNYYLGTNPYYLFNEINLSRSLENFDTYFNITSLNNNFNSQYLKFNIKIKTDYYILFLYSDKNSVLNTYEELVFSYSQYIFKIFKISPVNGNVYENKNIFYICFQNLKELNIFMIYIETGFFITDINELSNYFNLQKSLTFCNYKKINNYWVLNSLSEPIVPNGNPDILDKNKIYFSINNLNVNQIFLQGNFYITEEI